jgi:tRNA(Ile)-lysidine synthase
VRLRLLAQAARVAGASVVLFGHTLDDALEARLMRADGLRLGELREWASSPVWPQGRGVFHCRPLLGRRRADLRRELVGLGHAWIEDPANDDLRFARARARRRLAEGGDVPAMAAQPQRKISVAAGVRFDAGGGAMLRRSGAEGRLIAAVLACVSGREAPARPARVDALVGRLLCGGDLTAALGGCRIEARGEEVLVAREAGEWLRAGAPEVRLSPGQPEVWDGRFEVLAVEPGWRVRPLRGLTSRLPADEAAKARRLAPAVRAAAPVAVNEAETVTCPILASGPVLARGLVRQRLLGACGDLTRESEAAAATHGADEPDVLSSGGSLKKA